MTHSMQVTQENAAMVGVFFCFFAALHGSGLPKICENLVLCGGNLFRRVFHPAFVNMSQDGPAKGEWSKASQGCWVELCIWHTYTFAIHAGISCCPWNTSS